MLRLFFWKIKIKSEFWWISSTCSRVALGQLVVLGVLVPPVLLIYLKANGHLYPLKSKLNISTNSSLNKNAVYKMMIYKLGSLKEIYSEALHDIHHRVGGQIGRQLRVRGQSNTVAVSHSVIAARNKSRLLWFCVETEPGSFLGT